MLVKLFCFISYIRISELKVFANILFIKRLIFNQNR